MKGCPWFVSGCVGVLGLFRGVCVSLVCFGVCGCPWFALGCMGILGLFRVLLVSLVCFGYEVGGRDVVILFTKRCISLPYHKMIRGSEHFTIDTHRQIDTTHTHHIHTHKLTPHTETYTHKLTPHTHTHTHTRTDTTHTHTHTQELTPHTQTYTHKTCICPTESPVDTRLGFPVLW